MTFKLTLTVWLLAASAIVVARPQQTTIRSGTSAVMVDVTVHDRSRRAITGLSGNDFQVFDNGVPQQVDQVSYGKLPIDVTVALDVSYSVTGALLERLRESVGQLMRDLSAKDRLKLVLFNMAVTRTIDYTTDVGAVQKAIRGAKAGGATALLDAVSVTLVSASPPDRRHLIVFFTDGSDNSSTTSPEMVRAVAERTRATLAFVMPVAPLQTISQPVSPPLPTNLPSGFSLPSVYPTTGTAGSWTTVARPPVLLPLFSTLAADTGGSVLPVTVSGNLTEVFRQVLNEFRSAYVIYYNPSGVDRAGYHSIEVKVKRSGAVVRARRGYFAS